MNQTSGRPRAKETGIKIKVGQGFAKKEEDEPDKKRTKSDEEEKVEYMGMDSDF